jgi:hypothetical protein
MPAARLRAPNNTRHCHRNHHHQSSPLSRHLLAAAARGCRAAAAAAPAPAAAAAPARAAPPAAARARAAAAAAPAAAGAAPAAAGRGRAARQRLCVCVCGGGGATPTPVSDRGGVAHAGHCWCHSTAPLNSPGAASCSCRAWAGSWRAASRGRASGGGEGCAHSRHAQAACGVCECRVQGVDPSAGWLPRTDTRHQTPASAAHQHTCVHTQPAQETTHTHTHTLTRRGVVARGSARCHPWRRSRRCRARRHRTAHHPLAGPCRRPRRDHRWACAAGSCCAACRSHRRHGRRHGRGPRRSPGRAPVRGRAPLLTACGRAGGCAAGHARSAPCRRLLLRRVTAAAPRDASWPAARTGPCWCCRGVGARAAYNKRWAASAQAQGRLAGTARVVVVLSCHQSTTHSTARTAQHAAQHQTSLT